MSTIKDVAQKAGVSVSTVSRALSNRIFVEEETRRKVMRAVKELNYSPSIMAKGLREGKSYVLAFLVPDINSLFYPAIMKSIERVASENGYALFLCNNNESLEKERHTIEVTGSRGVDGVICMSVRDDISHLVRFQNEKNIPVVLINRDFPDLLNCVSVDSEYGGYVMTKYLLDRGHRRIAGVFGDFSMQRFRLRYEGCKRAMEEYGIRDYKRYFIYDVNSIEEAYLRAKEMLVYSDRPTAFFATMDILAIGVYRGITESGLSIPGDVSVVGYDNIFMTQYMTPALTTYNASLDVLAENAVKFVLEQIKTPDYKLSLNIKGDVVERESVKAYS